MRKLAVILPVLALCYLSSLANAQRFAPGYCPTVAAHENFDKTKFFGNWIEVEKTPSIFDLMMRCLVVDYSDDQDNTVNVVVRGISLAGLPLTVNGDGLLQDVHRSGFYSIRYGFGVPFQGTLTTIIDTDYDDYAVVYSCTNSLLSGVFHSEYIWVLSRSGKISNPTRQNIYEKLDKLAINRSGLTMSDRSTCPTNSSNVARESDNALNIGPVPVGGAQTVGANGLPAASSGAADQAISGPSSSPVANLEKASLEPTQKSVVVPLLYDPPSPASSSSVGSSKPSLSKSPPAPVENKVPQLPVSSSVPNKSAVAAAPGGPVAVVASSASPIKPISNQAQPVGQQPQAAPVQQPQQVQPQQQQVQQSAGSAIQQQGINPKSSNQQPQQQSLLAKIQQKP